MTSLEEAVRAWYKSSMVLVRPRLFLSLWSTNLSIWACFIMISKELPVLQKLHVISTFETEWQVKGISVPSTRKAKVDFAPTPRTLFPVSSPRSGSYGPASFKGSWESHEKDCQDWPGGFQTLLTIAHSEKHISYQPNACNRNIHNANKSFIRHNLYLLCVLSTDIFSSIIFNTSHIIH